MCYIQWINFYPNINIHLPTQPNANAWACAAQTHAHINCPCTTIDWFPFTPYRVRWSACLFASFSSMHTLPKSASCSNITTDSSWITNPISDAWQLKTRRPHYLRWQLKLSWGSPAQRRESHRIVTHLIELITQKDKMSQVKLASPAETYAAKGRKGRQNAKRRMW